MSKGFKFKLNRDGVRELMQSADAMGVVREYADQIRNRAGDGYEVSEYVGKTRVNASVYAATEEARKDNLENNTLLRAVGR
jgi:23S rRNA A2030 N6-methylase RlmJ